MGGTLGLIFGDQLDRESPIFQQLEKKTDRIWMAESQEEAGHVQSTKARIAVFFAGMRHMRNDLENKGWQVEYTELTAGSKSWSLGDRLKKDLKKLRPDKVVSVLPGEWRVKRGVEKVCEAGGIPVEFLEDTHFLSTPDEFKTWANQRKSIRLEYFYRELRKKHGVLIGADGKPVGGEWNYDAENREGFGQSGPGDLPERKVRNRKDKVLTGVIDLVNQRFADHPGSLSEETFPWPVNPRQAESALDQFIEKALPDFGTYQDAMWTNEPFLYHSLLSNSLNLKLLHPADVIRAAEQAYVEGRAPLNAVEGFIRQILGWREYVRGLYWWQMPGYEKRNHLEAKEDLPAFYWTGETGMECLRQAIGQTLKYGYAHHIQRLMVTGLYGLLLGVDPKQVHEWYLAVYVDAVEWVELPNTLGMSQFGDGGLMASKPYVATGKYIKRMSNYCTHCRFNPDKRTGEEACPFTTLYWDFLDRNEKKLRKIPRMNLQLRNLDRLSDTQRRDIREAAGKVKKNHA